MMPLEVQPRIYSATYSNVPVYEFNVESNHVMRRRVDDWINATHILKVADYDKPARTRVLEREVQKNVHEKVQGGYGKYQGTWVPLHDGRALAERNGVLHKLLPILDFVPGDRSPPPAPKHATAASVKARASKVSANHRKVPIPRSNVIEETLENLNSQMHDNESEDIATVVSDSLIDEKDIFNQSQYSVGSRKRKRSVDDFNLQDQQHQIWADALLDYFMLLESEDRFPAPPEPPPNVNLDRPIDDKGHSAMHWAASMGDVEVVKDLIRRRARVDCVSNNLETPLMRAVIFTNNYDKDTMPKMAALLQSTVAKTDCFGQTVFHHIAATTSSRNKYFSARYYLDTIINKLSETWSSEEITRLLDFQDYNGDSAVMIAARNGARKCVRALLGRNVSTDLVNRLGESADELIREMNARRQEQNRRRHNSSSPFQPDTHLNGIGVGNGVGSNGPNTFNPNSSFYDSAFADTQTTDYSSETANALKHKVMPAMVEKCEQLAAAYEAELEEKEAERADAERVARKRQIEVDATRKEINELMTVNIFDDEIDFDNDHAASGGLNALELELATLTSESETLLELEQRAALQRLISEEEARAAAQYSTTVAALTSDLTSSVSGDDEEEKVEVALALQRAQQHRRALVAELVQNQSVAGIGGDSADGGRERQAEYKRLITGALGVREEDVENMLGDILGELEEERERERLEASPL